jgi:hypothetical protein
MQHQGKRILHLNFSGLKSEDVLSVIREAKAIIGSQSPNSVLTLTDVTGTGFDNRVSEAMKDFVSRNKPFVVAAAVVGITGLKQIIFNAVIRFSGRKLVAFNKLEEAREWLAKQ